MTLEDEIAQLLAGVSPSADFVSVYTALHSELLDLPPADTWQDGVKHLRAANLAEGLGKWLHGQISDRELRYLAAHREG